MKPLGITLRLAVAFCLLAAMLVVVGWQGIDHLRQFNALIQNIVYDRWQEQLLSHRAYRLSSENSKITLEIFLVDDPNQIQQLLVQRAANTQGITELVDIIAPRLDTEKERQLFAVVQATRTPYLKSYQQALSLLLTQHKRDEARKMVIDVVQPNLTAYHNAWGAFNQYENDEIDQAIQQSNGEFVVGQRNFSLTLALAGFMTGAIAIFTVMRMNREMTVRHAAEASLQQAYDGLEQRVLERTVDLRKANEMLQAEMIERKRFEVQLIQSQKMETVGRLAGGIAHEFNSILTAIIGQSELLIADLPAESPLTRNAVEIGKAASRAATLTRQLLAYGRKQILQPDALDLNAILAGMEGALRHVMGVNADVRLIPATGLKAVKADAGQIEQVIMNLAINAHDAMPHGGKLTLETTNVDVGSDSMVPNPELKPGSYVMLAITDTGTGMSVDARSRAFEPFFSTKAVGEGTGLGLSTCYGIIKQSGGHISVYSEPGRGTTFKIYLPQVEQEVKSPLPRLDPLNLPRGTETILLVEDDPALREMAATLLGRLGYTVLTAANGIEALELKQVREIKPIDLLFTDVVMPHMSGRELSERMLALYPHTKILFTSAYTENAIIHQGLLKKGVALLQKPFTPTALARKMREVLDQPDTSRP